MNESTHRRPKWTNGWRGRPKLFSDVPLLCGDRSSPRMTRSRRTKSEPEFRYSDKFDSLVEWWKSSIVGNQWRNIYTLYVVKRVKSSFHLKGC